MFDNLNRVNSFLSQFTCTVMNGITRPQHRKEKDASLAQEPLSPVV